MKKIVIMALMLILVSGGFASAEETSAGEDSSGELTVPAPDESYQFPVIKPDVSIRPDYRFVHLNGSAGADEYDYLHDSISLGSEVRVFHFPHRFHLDLDIQNKKDYFGDISYAYEDMVLFRGINRTLFHNLENIRLIDLDPNTPSPGVDVRDAGRNYGVKVGISTVFLRLKTHDFPFHIYLDGSLVERDGTQQQRFLLRSGSNNLVRTSEARDVDWKTKTLVAGANSHLGPVEVDFSHGEKRFDPGGQSVLFDTYSAEGNPPGTTRLGGVYPHNLVPELKGSTNTLKLHTSYTGSIVASATFSKIDRKNEDSNAKADYFIGAGEVSWTVSPRMAVFVKYRHRETDIDTPDSVDLYGTCNPSNNLAGDYKCTIVPAISSIADTVSATARYRPLTGLTLWGDYSYDNVRRVNADAWDVPDSTQKNSASLSASLRILHNLNIRANYTHLAVNDPEYNTDPDRADQGRISLSWTPLTRLNTLISYSTTREKRDHVQFVEGDGSILTGGRRSTDRDMFLGSATYMILKDLSATASYAYIHYKVQQDINYDNASGPQLDSYVPDRNMAQSYALAFSYIPEDRLSLSTGVTYTISTGGFYPTGADLVDPVSIASFSALKEKETAYSFSGEYDFKGGFVAGLQYRYSMIDDVYDNPYNDVNDGNVHIVLLTLAKKF